MTTQKRPSSPLRLLLVVAEVVIAYGVVGLVAGLVWEAVWTPPTEVVQQHQVFYTGYDSLRRVFAGTGLYVVIAAVASALTACVCAVLTRQREIVVLIGVSIGSTLAAFVMREVGISRGPSDPAVLAKTSADGTPLQGALHVSGHSPYLVWPMTALFVLALVFFAWPGGRAVKRDDRDHFNTGDPAEAAVSEGRSG